MAERENVAAGLGREQAEKLDLEMHARLEAGLLETEPERTSQSMPTIRSPQKPSLWQALKRFFH